MDLLRRPPRGNTRHRRTSPEWKVTPLLAAYKTVGGAAVYIGEANQQFGPDFYTPPAKP
jgi:hypothetical protein